MNFFANDVVQKMVYSGQKEEVENIVNRMPSRPILIMRLKTIMILPS